VLLLTNFLAFLCHSNSDTAMYSQGMRGNAVMGGSDASTFTEAFAVLQNKSRLELEKLMEDNAEFDSLINGLAMVCCHFWLFMLT
jgi:hypothetical protein